ncbi:hypothetical protein C8Q76DRAFT_425370 [Earliella scabrosa]|nr:hypothetical protein C8Q76DRAFT_425370 [Earliella scabrosa]
MSHRYKTRLSHQLFNKTPSPALPILSLPRVPLPLRPMPSSRCEATTACPARKRCLSYSTPRSRFCAAHTREYRTLTEAYNAAHYDVKMTGKSIALAQEMCPGPLPDLPEVDSATSMVAWWVISIDRETHYRRLHNRKFFQGRDDRHNHLLVELADKRRRGIALLRLFRERGSRILSEERSKLSDVRADELTEAWCSNWMNAREQWAEHLRKFGDLSGEDEIAERVDEEMGRVLEL